MTHNPEQNYVRSVAFLCFNTVGNSARLKFFNLTGGLICRTLCRKDDSNHFCNVKFMRDFPPFFLQGAAVATVFQD